MGFLGYFFLKLKKTNKKKKKNHMN